MNVLKAGTAAAAATLLTGGVVLADAHPADVCLDTAPAAVAAEEWEAISGAVAEAVASRPAHFPYPTVDQEPDRLDISSGNVQEARGYAPCLMPGYEWSARFGRAFLDAGADRMLDEAPTTPGIDSSVDIEWHPAEARLRTVLVFAGPLDIPNGTCWIDEQLAVAADTVVVRSDQGVRTSPFAEGACGRVFDHLPDGGAGEQAVTLLPAAVSLPDGGQIRFVAQTVEVREDALVVAGGFARD